MVAVHGKRCHLILNHQRRYRTFPKHITESNPLVKGPELDIYACLCFCQAHGHAVIMFAYGFILAPYGRPYAVAFLTCHFLDFEVICQRRPVGQIESHARRSHHGAVLITHRVFRLSRSVEVERHRDIAVRRLDTCFSGAHGRKATDAHQRGHCLHFWYHSVSDFFD